MESEGMEKACTRNVLMSSASTRATPMRSGSSTQNGRFFFRVLDRCVPARPMCTAPRPCTARPSLGERIR
ncbi:hypothetical protein RB201_00655 [Streptomyces sp. S1A(2023)]